MIRELLDLEPLGDDRFDAPVPSYDYRPNLFGGQVAGQALRAAALTVASDRPPHSLHSYFVRSGRLDAPLAMQVERVRDGRSFTVRGVEAWQRDEVILDMVASFHVPEDGGRYSQPYPDVPRPDDADPDPFQGTGFADVPIETRIAFEAEGPPQPPFGTATRFWARSTESWDDDDDGLAAAYLAYVADMRTGTALVDQWEMERGHWMVTSLDHSLWFHDRVSPAEWVLVDLRRVAIGGNRGLVLGTMHAHDGRHVASFTQELVVRARPNRMQPNRMQPNRMQPNRMQPNRMEPNRMEPNRMEPNRMEPNRMEPNRMEPNRMQPNRMQPNRMQPNRMQ